MIAAETAATTTGTATATSEPPVPLCRLPGQPGQRFDVFFSGFADDFVGENGSGRSFVPIEGLEVVADELFIEARLRFAARS